MVDFLLLFVGVLLSLLLADVSPIRAQVEETSHGFISRLVPLHHFFLFLPVGIVLLWPFFHILQRIKGRCDGLTIGEWLWALAWLADLFFSGWILWRGLGDPPEILASPEFQQGVVVSYVIFMLSMGTISLVLFLFDLVARWDQPWTHHLSLALMIWPAIPLGAQWAWNIKL
jgi:hypothetical protein